MSPNSHESTDEVPDIGAPPQRLTVDVETLRRLVAEQFPQWSARPVAPVSKPGWDNRTFHLGDDLLVRLPSAAEYALAVEKEHRWLPELAERLPVPIPAPLGLGEPGAGYPFPWSVYGWLPGEAADRAATIDPSGLAEDVVGFLEALQRIDATGGPQPGVHNWFRGGTLRTFDPYARGSLAKLDGHLDADLATAAWNDALAARWDGVDVWFHGDMAPGNLLLDGGRLTAVIDFGTCGVGDPSCDLAIAWTLLTRQGRRLLRERLDVDEPTWSRGRGWALWKTLSNLANAVEDGDEPEEREARRVVEAILDDYRDAH
ncbi:aminoglycoside phosphotransferase family protein [Nocardioides sp. LS1]|uniref:aminoglycoside phosphotransferase family protein n=1 Tax=Nocardioides sp. LS1 TaxID=1027620 RepID=UPI0021AB6814|nr:aminoglycoside phosphotransferase family protein [Nocardioides sp. LS1]